MSPNILLKVALPVPLRRLFDYRPPAGKLPQIGCRCLVPFGHRKLVGMVIATGPASVDYDPSKLQTVIKCLDNEPLIQTAQLKLLQKMASYYHHPIGEAFATTLPTLIKQGKAPDHANDPVWRLTDKAHYVEPKQFKNAHRQQAAWKQLKQHPNGLTLTALHAMGISSAALKGLEKKHWATTLKGPPPFAGQPLLAETPLVANDQQQYAIDAIAQQQQFRGFLLDGVTGSGKTEVYLQVAEQLLAKQQQVLILVPEIGLTPQTLQRFKNRFNRPLASIHSGLTDNQRLQIWQAARLGEIDILLGTRSALFTPLPRLGLIIVDESHDSSYKQHDGCRYHARDLALWRGLIEAVPVVLGTATPSLEVTKLVADKRLMHLPLSKRAGSAKPPILSLLDCTPLSFDQLLHPQALLAITNALNQQQQALIFLNRRGYAPIISCHNCGWRAECNRCNSYMTWHKKVARLVCHHCDRQLYIPRHCPQCGSSRLGDVGAGTEKLEEYLSAHFTDTDVIRIDRDATRRKGSLEAKLARIHSGQPAILIGTQMLAKGHHFNNLTVTVVLDADSGFLSADFRGAEHAGSTILQVAGRTARAGQQGQVFIQSRHPTLPMLQTLLLNDWSIFSQQLLKERQLVGLPPYTHAALFSAESPDPDAALAFLQLTQQQFTPAAEMMLLGPSPAPLEKVAGRYRFQLLLVAKNRSQLHRQLYQALEILSKRPESRRCRWHLDIDPKSML